MKSKFLFLSIFGTLAINPVAIVASCAENVPTDDVSQGDTQQKLEEIAKTATFSVDNLNQLPSSVKPENLRWDQAKQYKNVEVKFSNLIHDDSKGVLGFTVKWTSNTNSFSLKIDPSDSRSIKNLLIAKNDPESQKQIKTEIKRLNQLNENKQLIDEQLVLNASDLTIFNQSPNQFLKHLKSLNSAEFKYQIIYFQTNNFFDVNVQTVNAKIILEVGLIKNPQVPFEQTSLNLELKVNDQWDDSIKPPMPNPDVIRDYESRRLNRNWNLNQTRFSIKQIESFKQTPNLILKEIKDFIPQQYFQYQIDNLNVNAEKGTQTLSFTIKARLWRDSSKPLKVITSKVHQFTIDVYDDQDAMPPAPTVDPNKSWEISLKNPDVDPVEIDFQNQSNGGFDLSQILIKNGSETIFNEIPTKNFLKEVIKDPKNPIININGDLPDDWNWDLNLEYIPQDDNIINSKDDLSLYIIIYYPSSKDLNQDLSFNLSIKNAPLNESQIPTTDPKTEFETFKNHFEQDIKPNVKLDLEAIKSGRDGVYQFAQINEKNFLNFTNQNWPALYGSIFQKATISAQDVKINYITNEISFKWQINGAGAWSSQSWTDDKVTTLKLNPNRPSQITSTLGINEPNAFILDQMDLQKFNINPGFVERDSIKSKLLEFSKNWTWSAREMITFLRFTFYQAFNDQAEKIEIGLVPKNSQTLPFNNLNQHFEDYKIILKAKLKFDQANPNPTFIPYIQMFGVSLGLKPQTFKDGDIITMELDIQDIADNPDPVQDANEIFPGSSIGTTLGGGLGYEAVIQNWPPRTDIWQAYTGTYLFTLKLNDQTLGSERANHRFTNFNLLSLYNFKDQFWPIPNDDPKWVNNWNEIK